jgi:SWI/SNF-related matrix-associated actin-dependent regulator of chromatin subfamily D
MVCQDQSHVSSQYHIYHHADGYSSLLGSSLVRFGRAQCKIAMLQEAFGLTFKDTFSRALARYEDEISEYQTQRKKLESRRFVYT